MRTTAVMPATDFGSPSEPVEPATASDAALLRALARGDRSAGEALVDRTYRRVWSAHMKFTGGDGDLAADLTQETYRRAWTAIASFDGRAAFATWLYRIAYTTFLNHVRRPRRVVPLDPDVEAVASDPAPDGEHQTLRAEQDQRVRQAVLALPDALRDTVAARFWGDLPVREIAASEGISEVAVRKRLRKAYGLLEAALEVTS